MFVLLWESLTLKLGFEDFQYRANYPIPWLQNLWLKRHHLRERRCNTREGAQQRKAWRRRASVTLPGTFYLIIWDLWGQSWQASQRHQNKATTQDITKDRRPKLGNGEMKDLCLQSLRTEPSVHSHWGQHPVSWEETRKASFLFRNFFFSLFKGTPLKWVPEAVRRHCPESRHLGVNSKPVVSSVWLPSLSSLFLTQCCVISLEWTVSAQQTLLLSLAPSLSLCLLIHSSEMDQWLSYSLTKGINTVVERKTIPILLWDKEPRVSVRAQKIKRICTLQPHRVHEWLSL